MRELGARRVNFFKGVVGAAMIGLLVWVRTYTPIPSFELGLLALSGVIGLSIGDGVLFFALGKIGPHRAALFMSLSPVITALGGWMMGETLSFQQVLGVLGATAGVALVVASRRRANAATDVPLIAILAGVMAASCQAIGVLLAKRGMPPGTDVYLATFVRLVAATGALAAYAVLRGQFRSDLKRLLQPRALFLVTRAAAIGTFLGLLLMQVGIQKAESAVASALHSTTPLFTLPIAVFFLKEKAGWSVILGSLLGVGGVIALLTA